MSLYSYPPRQAIVDEPKGIIIFKNKSWGPEQIKLNKHGNRVCFRTLPSAPITIGELILASTPAEEEAETPKEHLTAARILGPIFAYPAVRRITNSKLSDGTLQTQLTEDTVKLIRSAATPLFAESDLRKEDKFKLSSDLPEIEAIFKSLQPSTLEKSQYLIGGVFSGLLVHPPPLLIRREKISRGIAHTALRVTTLANLLTRMTSSSHLDGLSPADTLLMQLATHQLAKAISCLAEAGLQQTVLSWASTKRTLRKTVLSRIASTDLMFFATDRDALVEGLWTPTQRAEILQHATLCHDRTKGGLVIRRRPTAFTRGSTTRRATSFRRPFSASRTQSRGRSRYFRPYTSSFRPSYNRTPQNRQQSHFQTQNTSVGFTPNRGSYGHPSSGSRRSSAGPRRGGSRFTRGASR